jgi:hypothetical protein
VREYIESGIAVVVVVMALILNPWVGGLLGLGVIAERAFKAYSVTRNIDRLDKLEAEVRSLHTLVGMKQVYK